MDSYETRAGHVSIEDMRAKLLEHLRLAAECAYTIGHIHKANDEELLRAGWHAIGQLLERMVAQVIKIATKGILQ